MRFVFTGYQFVGFFFQDGAIDLKEHSLNLYKFHLQKCDSMLEVGFSFLDNWKVKDCSFYEEWGE